MIIVLLFCSADKIILSIREGSTQVLSISLSENQFGVQKSSSELPRKLKIVKTQFTVFSETLSTSRVRVEKRLLLDREGW